MSDERPSDEEVEMVAVQIQSHLDDQGSYACIDDDAPNVVRRLLAWTKRCEERVELVKRMHRVDMERAEAAEKRVAELEAQLSALDTTDAKGEK